MRLSWVCIYVPIYASLCSLTVLGLKRCKEDADCNENQKCVGAGGVVLKWCLCDEGFDHDGEECVPKDDSGDYEDEDEEDEYDDEDDEYGGDDDTGSNGGGDGGNGSEGGLKRCKEDSDCIENQKCLGAGGLILKWCICNEGLVLEDDKCVPKPADYDNGGGSNGGGSGPGAGGENGGETPGGGSGGLKRCKNDTDCAENQKCIGAGGVVLKWCICDDGFDTVENGCEPKKAEEDDSSNGSNGGGGSSNGGDNSNSGLKMCKNDTECVENQSCDKGGFFSYCICKTGYIHEGGACIARGSGGSGSGSSGSGGGGGGGTSNGGLKICQEDSECAQDQTCEKGGFFSYCICKQGLIQEGGQCVPKST